MPFSRPGPGANWMSFTSAIQRFLPAWLALTTAPMRIMMYPRTTKTSSQHGQHDRAFGRHTDYPVEEPQCSYRLTGWTDCNGLLDLRDRNGGEGVHTASSATDDTSPGCSGVSASGEPHDAKERQPADFDGYPGCQGAVAHMANGEPGYGCHEFTVGSH